MRLILTYHSLHASGWSYESNDHIALWHDLKALEHTGYTVLPLERIVDAVRHKSLQALPEKCVSITFDDGVCHDFIEFYHPGFGLLPSFRTIVENSISSGFPASATSFVIVSPEARRELDENTIAGRGDWTDCWWAEAASLEYWNIANHSWDHNHPAVSSTVLPDSAERGFRCVDTMSRADAEIAHAQEYLTRMTHGKAKRWFAYPYGDWNEFLAGHYLPTVFEAEAGFATGGEYLTEHVDLYRIPRFVCGEHWKTPAEFISMLEKNNVRAETPRRSLE